MCIRDSFIPVAHAASETLDALAARPYNLASGPLGRTLSSFAAQAGIALSFDPALTEGLLSPALSGLIPHVKACAGC